MSLWQPGAYVSLCGTWKLIIMDCVLHCLVDWHRHKETISPTQETQQLGTLVPEEHRETFAPQVLVASWRMNTWIYGWLEQVLLVLEKNLCASLLSRILGLRSVMGIEEVRAKLHLLHAMMESKDRAKLQMTWFLVISSLVLGLRL